MENEKDIFELSSEFEGDIITSNEDFDFAFREGLPYWMVEKYYRWDAAESVKRFGHILPETPEVGGVK